MLKIGWETDTMSMDMSAPVRDAVAHTFALALVSAPISCPAAYITAPRTIMSIAATGSRFCIEAQRSLTASVTSSPIAAKIRAVHTKERKKKTFFSRERMEGKGG